MSEIYEPIEFFPLKPAIEETVLYDRDQIRIVAKEINYSEYEAEVHLVIENRTSDTLWFTSNANAFGYKCNSINGYMFSFGDLDEYVGAGYSFEMTASIYGAELFKYGITDIADMELSFRIIDEEDEEILTGPCAIRTSIADTYDYSGISFANGMSDPRAEEEYGYCVVGTVDARIYDMLDLIVDSVILLESPDNKTLIALEATNNSSERRSLAIENVVVNGTAAPSHIRTSESINPGKKAVLFFSVDFFLDGLDDSIRNEKGIDAISSISFDLTQTNIKCTPSTVTLGLAPDEE